MALDSVLTFFALAISPAVAATFGCLIWFKRDPASQPSIVAAIPLGLSSIAILLAQSAVVLLATFQEIATHQSAGVRAVVAGLLKAQRPLIWGFVDLGVCLLILMLLSLSLRYSRDADTPPIYAFVSLTALIATAVVIAATFVMVYVQYGTVDLVMMVVDTHRNQEITAGYGAVSPAYIAARISSRLVATTFLSIALFCALIVAGAVSLFWRQKQNSRQAFATVLALGSVIGCGVSAMSELGFVDYLQHLH